MTDELVYAVIGRKHIFLLPGRDVICVRVRCGLWCAVVLDYNTWSHETVTGRTMWSAVRRARREGFDESKITAM